MGTKFDVCNRPCVYGQEEGRRMMRASFQELFEIKTIKYNYYKKALLNKIFLFCTVNLVEFQIRLVTLYS